MQCRFSKCGERMCVLFSVNFYFLRPANDKEKLYLSPSVVQIKWGKIKERKLFLERISQESVLFKGSLVLGRRYPEKKLRESTNEDIF